MRIRHLACTAALLVACAPLLSSAQAAEKKEEKPYVSPTPPALPPHLERGALVCVSRDDLVRYQTALVDRTAAAGSPAPDCHTVIDRTFVSVLGRDGPSRTQVSITGQAGEKIGRASCRERVCQYV